MPATDPSTARDSVLTREGWLQLLTSLLRGYFEISGYTLPPTIHVSVGWPSTRAKSRTNRRIGECWSPTISQDGNPHIFISPVLADPYDVAMTVVHELLHAAIGTEHGHKKPFKDGMKKLGLAGKPTATHAGPELTEVLKGLITKMPEYPHPALDPSAGAPKQKGRQRKLTCPLHPDYVARASKKVITEAPPLCGLCHVEGLAPQQLVMEEE